MRTVWKFLSCNLKLHTHHEHEEVKQMRDDGKNQKVLERERNGLEEEEENWGRERWGTPESTIARVMASIVWSHSSQARQEEMGKTTTLQPGENVSAFVSMIHTTRSKTMHDKNKAEMLSRSANLHLGLGLGKMLYSTPTPPHIAGVTGTKGGLKCDKGEQDHLLNKNMKMQMDRSGERKHKHTHKEERREHEQENQVQQPRRPFQVERCQRTVRPVIPRLSQGNFKAISSQQQGRTWVPLGHLPPRSISPHVQCPPRHSNTGDAGDSIIRQRQQVISPVAKDSFRPSTPRMLHVQVCL